jgi:hypothetical protein
MEECGLTAAQEFIRARTAELQAENPEKFTQKQPKRLERFQQQKGEREIPGGLQATTDLNGGSRPDSLIIGLAPGSSLTND